MSSHLILKIKTRHLMVQRLLEHLKLKRPRKKDAAKDVQLQLVDAAEKLEGVALDSFIFLYLIDA
jgi:hypothetical protein